MNRISAYSRPASDGGVTIDTEAMIVDIITVFKSGRMDEATLHAAISEMWPQVEVKVKRPSDN